MAARRYQLTIERNLFITKAAMGGPGGHYVVRLLVDTGSQFTIVPWEVIEAIGYDPGAQQQRQRYVSTTSTTSAPVVLLERFACLGRTLTQFPILSYTLPFAPLVDGILGMDFLHRFQFKIDTRRGMIESYEAGPPRAVRGG